MLPLVHIIGLIILHLLLLLLKIFRILINTIFPLFSFKLFNSLTFYFHFYTVLKWQFVHFLFVFNMNEFRLLVIWNGGHHWKGLCVLAEWNHHLRNHLGNMGKQGNWNHAGNRNHGGRNYSETGTTLWPDTGRPGMWSEWLGSGTCMVLSSRIFMVLGSGTSMTLGS